MSETAKAFVSENDPTTADGTLEGYYAAIRGLERWLFDLKPEYDIEITNEEHLTKLQEYDGNPLEDHLKHMKRKGYSGSSIHTTYHYLSSYFNHLDEEGEIGENPVDDIDITDYASRNYTKQAEVLKAKENVVYIGPDEFELLVENVREPARRNRLLCRLMWQTGIRASELINIRKSDVYLDEQRIRIKTSKVDDEYRDIWWRDNLDILMRWWYNSGRNAMPTSDDSEYLFISRYADQMHQNLPNKIVADAAENAGIQEILYTDAAGNERRKITGHTLRHSFAVRCVQNGMDIRTLQMLLGHQKISTTEKYLQFDDNTLRDKILRHGPT